MQHMLTNVAGKILFHLIFILIREFIKIKNPITKQTTQQGVNKKNDSNDL